VKPGRTGRIKDSQFPPKQPAATYSNVLALQKTEMSFFSTHKNSQICAQGNHSKNALQSIVITLLRQSFTPILLVPPMFGMYHKVWGFAP
jgi:histidinol-phosphate/aromatic aminotransferase/cobyric acid decarboxylase-like protein